MDTRKPIGRTDRELEVVFNLLPDARLCFDVGHAWQVDSTMGEAYWILKAYGDRLRQVHVSEVNSRSKHDSLSYSTIQSFQEIAHMIPVDIPLVLETPVRQDQMRGEMAKARFALSVTREAALVA
jgi:sugar phosphate isomerase/epimerase